MANLNIKIKPQFKDKVVGYNNQSLPLGQRDDLDILAQIAKDSGDPSLLELFEEIPSDAIINASKSEKTVQAIQEVTAKGPDLLDSIS